MESADLPEFELDRALASNRTAEGIHAVMVTDEWNTPNGTPNGGYVLALVLRAVAQESPLPDPLTVSISYFRPPAAGDAQIDVTAIRIGKRVSTFEAVLSQGDQPLVHAVASFHDADAVGDAQHASRERPEIADPDECIDVLAAVPLGSVPIVDRFDYRHDTVPGWMQGEPTGDTLSHIYLAYLVTHRVCLCAAPTGLVPVITPTSTGLTPWATSVSPPPGVALALLLN